LRSGGVLGHLERFAQETRVQRCPNAMNPHILRGWTTSTVPSSIGSSVGLSASAVKRRVDRLVADGVIRSFTIQVDPAVDGMSTEAYVELFCRGTVAPDELQRILQGVPEVVYAGTVTGSADAIVHMRARDITSLEDALERVRIAPNVDHTRSAIVLSRLVNRNRD
jgi:DNA-binding Lrp family transcriptional regulator